MMASKATAKKPAASKTAKKSPKKKSKAEASINFGPASRIKVVDARDNDGCEFSGKALANAIADGSYVPTLNDVHPLQKEISVHPLQEIVGLHPAQASAK